MLVTSTGPVGNYVKDFYSIDLPYFFQSADEAYKALDSVEVGRLLMDQFYDQGIYYVDLPLDVVMMIWNAGVDGGIVFFVAGMNGSGIYNQINVIGQVGSNLGIVDYGAHGSKLPGQVAFLPVGTADGETALHQKLCKPAHADSADADEMYMNRFFEVECKHFLHSFVNCSEKYIYTIAEFRKNTMFFPKSVPFFLPV